MDTSGGKFEAGSAGWDAGTLRRRVSGFQRRYEACSPNAEESAVYADAVADLHAGEPVVVLGMTPELRIAISARFENLVSVDRSHDAIALYRDWLPADRADSERIVCSDWFSALESPSAAMAVFADGCLPNLEPDAQDFLLVQIRRHLKPGGRFVTRQPNYPEAYLKCGDMADALMLRRRQGWSDDDAFGAALRLKGFLASCYDRAAGCLDNAAVYARIDTLFRSGELSADDYDAVNRFRFDGFNWIFNRDEWERRLVRSGFRFRRIELTGRDWFEYYPFYICERME